MKSFLQNKHNENTIHNINTIMLLMKKTTFLFFFTSCFAHAQNLVQNPSFEDTVSCPNAFDQMYRAAGWSSFRGTPDYFNGCAQNTSTSVPVNTWGYQPTYDGNAYAFCLTFNYFPGNLREYIGSEL